MDHALVSLGNDLAPIAAGSLDLQPSLGGVDGKRPCGRTHIVIRVFVDPALLIYTEHIYI